MVLLIKDSTSIEYMNPSAKGFLGDLCKPPEEISPEELTAITKFLQLVSQTIKDKQIGDTLETTSYNFV